MDIVWKQNILLLYFYISAYLCIKGSLLEIYMRFKSIIATGYQKRNIHDEVEGDTWRLLHLSVGLFVRKPQEAHDIIVTEHGMAVTTIYVVFLGDILISS